MSKPSSPPSPFESLAGICKFIAVQRISPEFYSKHWQSIEFANAFARTFASRNPVIATAFRTTLPMSIADAALPIQQAISSANLNDEDIQWFDTQMTETLRTLLAVVRDSDLPLWLNESKWAIEGAFE